MSVLWEKSETWRWIVRKSRDSKPFFLAFATICGVVPGVIGYCVMQFTNSRNPELEAQLRSNARPDSLVRALWLPLHLWGEEFFKRFDDACGGFVVVDKEMKERCFLQWARILVKSNRRRVPHKLQVVVGADVFEVQLWWEIIPGLPMVVPKEKCRDPEVRDDSKGLSQVGGRIG
ncbi:hypothetical protein VitviT2T_030774 [Vitis vinifera]|uniref:DUF4283 domain-containing protein n=1 Tax=Vitis vinifera TaxID=29760 RepID=A0ABY9E0M5_VITVI|nr:hypothetical protein VitviT2T_030774 [Vitis vinifera]